MNPAVEITKLDQRKRAEDDEQQSDGFGGSHMREVYTPLPLRATG